MQHDHVLKVDFNRSEVNANVTVAQNGTRRSALSRCIHFQIWDSYLKKYRRYAQDRIILETKSEVYVNVRLTVKWYTTLRHPKMQSLPLIRLEICSCHDYCRNEVKVTVTLNWNSTLGHPKMHPHTLFGISASNNVGGMLRIRLFQKEVREIKVNKATVTVHTNFLIPTSNNVWDMLRT